MTSSHSHHAGPRAQDTDDVAEAHMRVGGQDDSTPADREHDIADILAAGNRRDALADERDTVADQRDMAANLDAFVHNVDDDDAFRRGSWRARTEGTPKRTGSRPRKTGRTLLPAGSTTPNDSRDSRAAAGPLAGPAPVGLRITGGERGHREDGLQ